MRAITKRASLRSTIGCAWYAPGRADEARRGHTLSTNKRRATARAIQRDRRDGETTRNGRTANGAGSSSYRINGTGASTLPTVAAAEAILGM